MRFKTKKRPRHGDVRYRKKFFFLPTNLTDLMTGEEVTIWFETVTLQEMYTWYEEPCSIHGVNTRQDWVVMGFTDLDIEGVK